VKTKGLVSAEGIEAFNLLIQNQQPKTNGFNAFPSDFGKA